MKVKKLIKKLSELPDDARVMIVGSRSHPEDIKSVVFSEENIVMINID
jgi:hypothetical protein